MLAFLQKMAGLGSGKAVTFRALVMQDAPACASIHAANFAHGWGAGEFEAMLAATETIGDVASLGSRHHPAGFIVSRLAADEAEILTLAVDVRHRRAGIGRRMLAKHMGRLAARGARKLFLEVEEQNIAARGLYAVLGFQEVGRRPAYYRKTDGSAAHALVLSRDLTDI